MIDKVPLTGWIIFNVLILARHDLDSAEEMPAQAGLLKGGETIKETDEKIDDKSA